MTAPEMVGGGVGRVKTLELKQLHDAAKGCEFDLSPADGPIAKLVLFMHEHGGSIIAALTKAGQDDGVERARRTMAMVHHFWLIAAKEALQGDLGKLRRHVSLSEGQDRADVIAEMAAKLPYPPAEGRD